MSEAGLIAELPSWSEEELIAALEQDGRSCSRELRAALEAALLRLRPRAEVRRWTDELVKEALADGQRRHAPERWLEVRAEAAVRGIATHEGWSTPARAWRAVRAHPLTWIVALLLTALVLTAAWAAGGLAGSALVDLAHGYSSPRWRGRPLQGAVQGWALALGACLVLPALLALVLPACAGRRPSARAALEATLEHGPTAVLTVALLPYAVLPPLALLFAPILGWLVAAVSVATGLVLAVLAVALSVQHSLAPMAALTGAISALGRHPRVLGGVVLTVGVTILAMLGLVLLESVLLPRAARLPFQQLALVVTPLLLFGVASAWIGVAPRPRTDGPAPWGPPRAFARPGEPSHLARGAGTALLVLTLGTPALYLLAEELPAGLIPKGAALPGTFGLHMVALLGGMILLRLDHVRARAVAVDRLGALLDAGPDWPGTRLAWRRVAGFQLEATGARLVLVGRPWTRFVGPVVPARDEEAHALVQVLEEAGVPPA